MTEEDPVKAAISAIVTKRDGAVAGHEALRKSQNFETAASRTTALVSDYTLGLQSVSMMSTRWSGFGQTRLSLRMHDLFLESAISTLSLVREGMLNPARRELRFLLEASIKA